jgi:hypothetical protein
MRKIVTLVVCLAVATLFAMLLFYLPALAQSQLSLQAKDPGVRAGSVDAGQALSTLSPGQSQYFTDGLVRFNEVDQVENGLGPTFNSNSCASCHGQPAAGGSSPRADQYPNTGPNPQIAAASAGGATNRIPSLLLRTARFVRLASPSSSVPADPSPKRRTAACMRCSPSPGAAMPGVVPWRNPISSKWRSFTI